MALRYDRWERLELSDEEEDGDAAKVRSKPSRWCCCVRCCCAFPIVPITRRCLFTCTHCHLLQGMGDLRRARQGEHSRRLSALHDAEFASQQVCIPCLRVVRRPTAASHASGRLAAFAWQRCYGPPLLSADMACALLCCRNGLCARCCLKARGLKKSFSRSNKLFSRARQTAR